MSKVLTMQYFINYWTRSQRYMLLSLLCMYGMSSYCLYISLMVVYTSLMVEALMWIIGNIVSRSCLLQAMAKAVEHTYTAVALQYSAHTKQQYWLDVSFWQRASSFVCPLVCQSKTSAQRLGGGIKPAVAGV